MRTWFKNLKIGTRIISGFLLIVIIAGIIGGVGIISLYHVDNSYGKSYTESVQALQYMEKISASFQEVRTYLTGLLLVSTTVEKAFYEDQMDAAVNVIDENLKQYKEMLDKYDENEVRLELALIGAIQDHLSKFKLRKTVITQGIFEGNRYWGEDAHELIKDDSDLDKLWQTVNDYIDRLIKCNIENSMEQIDKNQEIAADTRLIMIIGIIIGIFLAILIGLYISKDISKELKRLLKVTNALALGDIDIEVETTRKDELGMVGQAFGKMIDSIREHAFAAERIAEGDLTVEVPVRSEKDLLGQKLFEMLNDMNELLWNITSSSEQVAAGAEQMSESSVNLSQGAAEQASSIEELTAAIEEISSQTKFNAENANKASKLAEKAQSNASQGNIQMKEMLQAMEEINKASTNISKIIKVIDDIAFQTNILALNAAVEAARAGQHGKGFAVVAEEVRNLAARSASAAKETTDMIEDSIKKAEEGTQIAQSTAEALNRIVNGVERVSNLLKEIASASNEQAEGIEQINQGIVQVSQVVESNSATAEESATASEELSNQAQFLKEMVGKFKLKQDVELHSDELEDSDEELEMPEDSEGIFEENEEELNPQEETYEEAAVAGSEIELSDKEFGKY